MQGSLTFEKPSKTRKWPVLNVLVDPVKRVVTQATCNICAVMKTGFQLFYRYWREYIKPWQGQFMIDCCCSEKWALNTNDSPHRFVCDFIGKRSAENVLANWETSKQGYCGRQTVLDWCCGICFSETCVTYRCQTVVELVVAFTNVVPCCATRSFVTYNVR